MPYAKTKEGSLVNEVTLGDGYPLSNDLQPLKIGGEASILGISSPLPDGSDSGLFRVDGDLDITGTLKTKLSHDLIYDFDDEVNTLAQAKVDALIDSAPAALDTLNELAAALGDDASFATTVTNSIATKVGLTGNETIAGVKTFSSAVTIHTATDAILNFKSSDDSWSYMQFLQNDGDRIAYIGIDGDQDRLILNATENGANEIEINTTTVDISGNVDIAGTLDMESNNITNVGTITASAFTGTASVATTVTVADESTDTDCFPLYSTASTGNQAPKSGTNLRFNSNTGLLTATKLAGTHEATNIGATGSTGIDSATNTAAEYSDLPIGYSAMMHSSLGTDEGMPLDSKYFYFHKIANRDSSGGWGGLAFAYSQPFHAYLGMTTTSDDFATWYKILVQDGSGAVAVDASLTVGGGTGSTGTTLDYAGNITMDGNLMLRGEGGIFVENSDTAKGGSIIQPAGGMYRTSSNSHTGAIKIALPTGTGQIADMISFWVDVYDYTVGESFSVFIGGYVYQDEGSNEWVNESATVFGNLSNRDFSVRFGHDESNHCVLIGEVDSTWSYPQVTVRNVQVGYAADIDDWTGNWAITFETSLPTIDETEATNFPATNNIIVTDGDSDGTSFPLFVDSATGVLAPHTNAEFTWDASNSRLGIGTDPTPNYKVHAKGTGWGAQGIGVESSSTSGAVLTLKTTQRAFEVSSRGNGFNIRDLTDSDTSRFNINSSGTASFEDNNITNVGDIALDTISSDAGTSINVTLGTDAGDDFIVDTDTLVVEGDNNRVGIGTTSPSATLHISDASNSGVTSLSLNNRVKVRGDGVVTWGSAAAHGTLSWDSGKTLINSQGTNDLQISAGGNHTDHIYIDGGGGGTDGYVGVGTNSPTTKLDVEGSVSYKHISLTADSDDLDVSDCTVVECTPSGTDRLGGLTGGVQGQVIHILKVDSGFGRIIIEHNEGTGNQDIFLSGGSDITLTARGGITLYCNGTSWFALDK